MEMLWGIFFDLAEQLLWRAGCWIVSRYRTWQTRSLRIRLQASMTLPPMTGQCTIMTRQACV